MKVKTIRLKSRTSESSSLKKLTHLVGSNSESESVTLPLTLGERVCLVDAITADDRMISFFRNEGEVLWKEDTENEIFGESYQYFEEIKGKYFRLEGGKFITPRGNECIFIVREVFP